MEPDQQGGESGEQGAVLEPIPRDECIALLGTQVIGRVAVAEFNAAPLIVPVNFVLDGESIVFRTDYGSKFRMAVLREEPVSFEIDGVDPGRRSGWSVLVQGSARELPEEEVDRLQLRAWAPGRKSHFVQIVPASITGRRIRLSDDLGPDAGRGYL